MVDDNGKRRRSLEEILRFAAFFKSKYPENILIPLQLGSKCPAMTHKGGRFTWNTWDMCMKKSRRVLCSIDRN